MTIRVERGHSASIDQPFFVDGVLTDADSPVTVTVTRDDGSAVVTNAGTTNPSTGVYRFALAPQTDLDLLTLTYSGTWSDVAQTEVQRVEIVGDFYFSIAEGRATDASFTVATYPNDVIVTARQEVEDAIEAAVAQALGKGVAFVQRFRRISVNGNDLDAIEVPDYFVSTIRSASISGVALTDGQLADLVATSGRLSSTLLTWTRGMRNVVVAYEHGMDAPPPLIKRAALLLFKAWLPAFKASGESPAPLRSLSLDGVSIGFASAEDQGLGVRQVERLISTWLAAPDISCVSTT